MQQREVQHRDRPVAGDLADLADAGHLRVEDFDQRRDRLQQVGEEADRLAEVLADEAAEFEAHVLEADARAVADHELHVAADEGEVDAELAHDVGGDAWEVLADAEVQLDVNLGVEVGGQAEAAEEVAREVADEQPAVR